MLKTKYKYSSLDRCCGKGLLQLALRANSELSSSFPKQLSTYVFSYVYAQWYWYKFTYSAHVAHITLMSRFRNRFKSGSKGTQGSDLNACTKE